MGWQGLGVRRGVGRVRWGGGDWEGAMGRGRWGGGQEEGDWEEGKGEMEKKGQEEGDFTDGNDEMPGWDVTEFSDFVYPCNAGAPASVS